MAPTLATEFLRSGNAARSRQLSDRKEVIPMRALAIAVVILAFTAGCASDQAPYPGASPRSYTTKSECESAGRTWDRISGVCM
jgi:hypothetical protein